METFKKIMAYPIVLLTCGVLWLAGLIALGLGFDFNKSDWAAWVQALGSIAAILGAYAVGERQASHAHRVAIETQRASIQDRRRAILECCKLALSRAKLVERIFTENYDAEKRKKGYYPELLLSVRALLKTIQPADLNDYKAIARFLELKSELRFLVRSIEEFDKQLDLHTRTNGNINAPKDLMSQIMLKAPVNRALSDINHHVDYIKRAVNTIETAVVARG